MPRYEFNPGNGFVPAASYRLDTAPGSTSPATIEYLFTEGAVIPGSTLAADMQGALPDFAASVATLYAKQLTAAGTVTGSPITLAARQPELGLQPAPGGGAVSSVVGQTGPVTGAQIAADPALGATFGLRAPDWVTGRAYIVGELATSGGTLYRCTTAHTSSGSIALGNFASLSGGSVTIDADGTISDGTTTIEVALDADVAALSASTTSALATKANLASPAFTGNPTAPTPSPGDNDTSIATTAFVTAAVAAGGSGGGVGSTLYLAATYR